MNPLLLFAALAVTVPQDTARLTIGIAVERALATYPSVAVARANVDVASAEVGQSRGSWLPSVSFDASVNKFEKPMVVYPLHSLDLRNPPLFDTGLSQFSVGAAYTLLDFGARASKVRAAESQRTAASASLSAAEQMLAARTASSYLRVLTTRQILGAEDQHVAALGAESKRARDRFAAGKSAQVDTMRAASELASALADRVASATDVALAEHDLARLVGVSVDAIRSATLPTVRLVGETGIFSASGTGSGVASPDRAALLARAEHANADVQAAERRADAASASIGAAKAGRLPQLQATSAIVDRSNITGRYLAEWQMGLGLSWPIFTGGARESGITRAEASARVANEQLRQTKLAIEQQVDEAQSSLDAARARVASLGAAVVQAAEVARITQLARDVGEGTQTDYLLAESNLFRARSSLVQARHAVIAARVELARVTGELSRAWIANALESQP